ncbi:hypothetical protein MA6G0728R_0011 [Mycobacteroides abscessus 6G-0728-R]|nr:hypothetical protein MA6G0728R_0011 [Mycobacteroides abscessus 6G-0728-R]EIV32330.1 hypothetical protein MA3A0122S_5272 [Mycobacteroides abscessus 3A-0122-S]EIV58210.1 hypothetical protein MA3A0930S_0012 [Mycobacteroides abscessus 3A-0930-S]
MRAGHPNRCRAPRQCRILGDDCRLSRFEPIFDSPQDLIANVIHPRSHGLDGTPPAVPNLLVELGFPGTRWVNFRAPRFGAMMTVTREVL